MEGIGRVESGTETEVARKVLCTWASIKDFLSCLSEKEIVYDDETMEGGVHHFGDSKGHEVKH